MVFQEKFFPSIFNELHSPITTEKQTLDIRVLHTFLKKYFNQLLEPEPLEFEGINLLLINLEKNKKKK